MKHMVDESGSGHVKRLSGRGASRPPTAQEVASWLTERVAGELGVERKDIRSDVPFERYGLDSRIIAAIGGDLEEWLGRVLEPMLLWDYPTIEQVSEQLAAREVPCEVANRRAS